MTDSLWKRYQSALWFDRSLGVMLDPSRHPDPEALDALAPAMQGAFEAMKRLEAGAIANPDEERRVGHYWLRDPKLAPDDAIRNAIVDTLDRIKRFAGDVHQGRIKPPGTARFTDLLLIGIGGSALGPQLVTDALGGDDRIVPHFIDNTDPDGIDRTLASLESLASTMVLVVSKSGGTRETRNGMLEVAEAYRSAGLAFGPHAVAVTGVGSALESTARKEEFLEVFPMWDWVGGRTSVLSAVGLLPAALQGIDIDSLLAGAREMDVRTRVPELRGNPAALLAAFWHSMGNGRGDRDMVILPYKDRLLLLSRYLQQLVMESLGKEKDLEGNTVHQGIVVYGNKGSTDQHAYVQQLRDGPDNFFATFIEVQEDRHGTSMEIEREATTGDYLLGFLLGTREALFEKGRASITVTIPRIAPVTLGMLIALFERAVGLYASLIGINAYHQPGVEAGKQAAERVLDLQRRALAALSAEPGREVDAETLAGELGADPETLFKVLEHAASNPDHGVVRIGGERPWEHRYRRHRPS